MPNTHSSQSGRKEKALQLGTIAVLVTIAFFIGRVTSSDKSLQSSDDENASTSQKLAAWITATADGTPAAAQRAHSIIASTLKHQPENGAQLMQTLKTNNHLDLDTMMTVMQSSLTDKNTPALLKWAKETTDRELGDAVELNVSTWQARKNTVQ